MSDDTARITPTHPDLTIDTVIYGGTVYDGTGSPGISADITLSGDTIAAIAPAQREAYPGAKQYDAAGCAVAPGFIDIHTHSDLSILANPIMASSIHQGVTTELAGNCGIAAGLIDSRLGAFKQESAWLEREGVVADWGRMSKYMERLESTGISSNIATLAGHGTIRKTVMDFANRAPTPDELKAMQNILANAMDDGAVGLSTGLEYVPGGYADLDELCALATVARDAGGFYASHLRNEGDTLLESVEEALTVGERAQIPVQLSHHKAEGRANWGKVKQTMTRMYAARAAGMDVMTDQYPYTAFMTGLSIILLPLWAREGTPEEVVERLENPKTRESIEKEIAETSLDYDAIQIGIARGMPEVQGLTLTQLGARDRTTPARAAIDLLIAEKTWVAAAHFAISEEDVEFVLRDPNTMIGSDGVATAPGAPEQPHPRSYGTFPRVLGRYVRERNVLSLPDAIRRMTTLPAARLKLADRGQLAPGYKADITVFRPDTIADLATFDAPHQFPTGVEYVFVNGTLAVDRGQHTGARTGRVLRRQG